MSEVVDHPTLGRLTCDNSQHVWRGEIEVRPGLRVIVTVEAQDEEVEAALAGAAHGVVWLRGHEEEARLLVADAYLDTFNQNWTEEGPITREEFARRIVLVEASFGITGGPTLWYDDGDLFAGHSLSAHFDADGRFEGANLWG
jgi:hypothetical protein